MLYDILMSVLYGRSLWTRRQFVARMTLHLKPLADRGFDGNALYRKGLPLLPMQRGTFGTRVTTPHLSILLTDDLGVRGGLNRAGLPCDRCDDWDPGTTLAVHCLDKKTACIDLSNCSCLDERLRVQLAKSLRKL